MTHVHMAITKEEAKMLYATLGDCADEAPRSVEMSDEFYTVQAKLREVLRAYGEPVA